MVEEAGSSGKQEWEVASVRNVAGKRKRGGEGRLRGGFFFVFKMEVIFYMFLY